MCEPGSGRGARVLCSEAGEGMSLRKGEGTGRTLKVKGAQRRPWRSRSWFQSGCARVAGVCPQLEGVAHRPETGRHSSLSCLPTSPPTPRCPQHLPLMAHTPWGLRKHIRVWNVRTSSTGRTMAEGVGHFNNLCLGSEGARWR